MAGKKKEETAEGQPQEKKKEKEKAPRPTSLDQMIGMVETQYGSNALMGMAGWATSKRAQAIPTDLFQLDVSLGGGLYRGRFVTVWGPPSTGKSTLCMATIAQYQRHCRLCGLKYRNITWEKLPDKVNPHTGEILSDYRMIRQGCGCKDGIGLPMKVVYIAVERAFDPVWAAAWGVNLNELYLMEPEYGEQATDMGAMALSTYDCDLLILDSVAAMVPLKELEGSAEDALVGAQARLMTRTMRVWAPYMHTLGGVKTKPTIMATNQVRVNIAGYGGLIMGGGKGFEHMQDVIIQLKRPEKSDIKIEGDAIVGQMVEFHVMKNKLAPPKRMGQYAIYYMDDPREKPSFRMGTTDTAVQVVTAASWWGMVTRSKSGHYEIPGVPKKLHGNNELMIYFGEHPDELEDLKGAVLERERRFVGGDLMLPPEMRSAEELIVTDAGKEDTTSA